MDRDELLMLVRLGIQWPAALLTFYGIGNAMVWDAFGGFAVGLVGFLWSRHARRKLRRRVALNVPRT